MSRLKALEDIFQHTQHEAGHLAHRASHIADGHGHGAHDETHAANDPDNVTRMQQPQAQPAWMQSTLATPAVVPEGNVANVPYAPKPNQTLAHDTVDVAGIKMDRSSALNFGGMGAEAAIGTIATRATDAIGVGASVVGSAFRIAAADAAANDQIKDIAAEYAEMIGNQLGVPADNVTPQHLALAAQTNPTLQEALKAVGHNETTEKASAVTEAGGALAGMGIGTTLAAATTLAIPGVGWIAAMGGAMAGGFGARHLTQWMAGNEPDRTALAHIQDIEMKMETAGEILPLDVFQVRVRQNPQLARSIKERYGEALEDMTEAQQTRIMLRDYPQYGSAAAQDAMVISSGQIDPKMLAYTPEQLVQAQQQMQAYEPVKEFADAGVAEMQPEAGSWAARVGGPREMHNGFASQIAAERAAAEFDPRQI